MKKIFIHIIQLVACCILIFNLTSCADDGSGLLDKAESGELNEDRVFSNAGYTGQFLTDIYRRMPNGWLENVYLDATTDIGESRPWWGWVNTVHTGAYNAADIPGRLNRWADYYAAIRACNKFLEHIDDVPADPEATILGSILNDSIREQRKYEAVCLRAYFYSELVRCYGGVPLITKTLDINSPELYTSRATLQEMKDFIVEECDKAAAHLVSRQTGMDYPRMTSTIAKGIKARFLLHLASPLFNNNVDALGNATTSDMPYSWGSYDKQHWKDAADAAMEVLTNDSYYKLVVKTENSNYFPQASYPGSWKAMGWFNVFVTDYNTEVFIANPYKGNTNELEKWQLPGSFNTGGDAAYTLPTYNYAAIFETQEGIPVYKTDDYGVPLVDANGGFEINPASGFDPQKPYDNRDSRFYHSLYYEGAKFSNLTIHVWRSEDGRKGSEYQVGYANTGLFLRKFLNPKAITRNNSGIQGTTSHRYPLMRYVEFILAYAEAQNEYLDDGADRSAVIEQLDKIRQRADMPDVRTTFQRNGWSITNKKQMRKFIRNERTIELAFEDNRFYDVRRWKIGEETQKTIYAHDVILNNDGSITYKIIPWERRLFQAKDHLLPIPQGEINNNENLVQNPGW
ncbi:RagB/SusD family nutrient uptake outer membrane protein [Parabacteroides pacaensis]|uniref:RagB/SusD family nutrient uptake outer membrane protein n=1 Tax=Parabacteroides pacaensis TaxID=2086575 RepID=UPI00131C196A|nr:RagB/SusD family nutrient uptake outer membrane protein [Parabacteroides pacaensis]